MLEIYRTTSILKNYPLDIECMHAYGDHLLVGTKQGNLLLFKLILKPTKELKFDVHLLRANKAFSKKPIIQVAGVPEFHLIISLYDNLVNVHDLDKVVSPLLTSLHKTKGATLFVLNVLKCQTLTGDIQYTLRMCVVVKRKLMFFYWKNDKFLELAPDINVPDTPKAIAWCSESLCVGFRNEYCMISVSGEKTELFPLGKYPEPLLTSLEGDRFAVGIDEKTFFLEQDAKSILKCPVIWSDCPLGLVEDSPYLIALLPNNVVEIRTAQPRLSIQRIDELTSGATGKLKHLIRCVDKKGILFVCSNKDLYCLVARPIDQQTSQLIQSKEFDLAKQLVNISPDFESDAPESIKRKEMIIGQIENLQAFDYFCKKEFVKAMDLFLKLETHPSLVIGFFPGFLPEDFRNELEYPHEPPVFKGADIEAGIFALIDYLLEVRKKLQKLSEESETISSISSYTNNVNKSNNQSANCESSSVNSSPSFKQYLKSRDKLLEIVDTTLLKCYLQTNDGLVSSLVRLPDNHCHLQESETWLKRYHKYGDLIIFYQTRGLHRKALDLLFIQAKQPNSSLPGHERTIQYLQHLGESNLSLIFEYAEWVLKDHPLDGLRIFSEDIAETETLPRDAVLEYLQKICPELIIPYLEHIISIWKDRTPTFHNILANKYREKVKFLREEYIVSLPEGQLPLPAGQEPGDLGLIRKKLLTFLETSDFYSTETLSIFLLNDELWEERAIVSGKMGHHKDALSIYALYLRDYNKAEQYCIKVYSKDNPNNRDVFLILLNLYVNQPSESSVTTSTSSISSWHHEITDENYQENIIEALRLLKIHATKIDPIRALLSLPSTINIISIKSFLETVTMHLIKDRHDGLMYRNLLLSQHLAVQQARLKLHQEYKIIVEDSDKCKECQKRIGTSAFLRYPNGDLVHYSCKDRRAL
ncbi:vam6/Vps39-like protein isoform X2 [Panonychus citri]|nr:vam6/Vps39-like protein isoform X2 [Panonychus citri]